MKCVKIFGAVAFVAFVFGGCSSMWRPEMPETKVEFKANLTNADIGKEWWREFGDEKLNTLVQKGLENNINLALALANLEISRVNLNIARSAYLPFASLDGSAGRSKISGESASAASLKALGKSPSASNSFSLSAVLSYEIDLWGRVRNTVEAQKATFRANVYDYESARVSIAAGVVEAYFNLIMLKEQEKVLRESLATYQNTLNYRAAQLKAGAIDRVTELQARASVDGAKVQLLEIQTALSSAQTALAVLVGKDVEEILGANFEVSANLPKAPKVPQGVSADILSRRADVAKAFETLRAQNALVGVARVGWLPTLSLTGLFGFESVELKNLFKSSAVKWSAGGAVAMPLLDWGKTYNNVQLAKLSQTASFLNYQNVVRNAFGEVRNALVARENALKKEQAMQNYYASVAQIYNLTRMRYNSGAATHLEFLDAQRQLLSVRLNLVSAKLSSVTSAVGVFKAFGGGFKAGEDKLSVVNDENYKDKGKE